MKRRKVIETVRGYKFRIIERRSLVNLMVSDVSNTFFREFIVLILGHNFVRPIWRANVNFMRHFFFSNRWNPAKWRSRINPPERSHVLLWTLSKFPCFIFTTIAGILSWIFRPHYTTGMIWTSQEAHSRCEIIYLFVYLCILLSFFFNGVLVVVAAVAAHSPYNKATDSCNFIIGWSKLRIR